VFRSDGATERVDLDSAGPSDACLKAALGSAHVEPFFAPRYALRVTVRP
jgi:hypothetical protein